MAHLCWEQSCKNVAINIGLMPNHGNTDNNKMHKELTVELAKDVNIKRWIEEVLQDTEKTRENKY